MDIRDALQADLDAITAIYNDAVENTTAIWNERVVDVENRRAWMVDRQAAGYPVLVADDDGDIVGYATFGDYRPFDGYRHTVEHSVYVRFDQHGRQVGWSLMVELIERARQLDKHVMIAAVDAENSGSIRLHEKLGFVPAGELRQVGTKFGRWLDLAFLQLTLDDRVDPDGRS